VRKQIKTKRVSERKITFAMIGSSKIKAEDDAADAGFVLIHNNALKCSKTLSL